MNNHLFLSSKDGVLPAKGEAMHTRAMRDDMRESSGSRRRKMWLTLAVVVLMAPNSAEAEEGVAGSGMLQGSGAITTRSDVTLSVESLPGTSMVRLGAIGQAVQTQMEAIRGCYVEVTESRPTVTGRLQLRVRIGEGRGSSTELEIAQNTTGDQELVDCVTGAIRRAPFMNIRGPAGGLIVIQFENTAAEGAALVAREAAQAVDIVREVDGRPQASARTPQGEVELILAGTGSTDAAAVGAFFRATQARIGSLLDCRRRASRRGQDPSGEMVLTLRVPVRGAAAGRRRSSTIHDPNAPQCALRMLGQAARGESAAAGTYEITIRFASR